LYTKEFADRVFNFVRHKITLTKFCVHRI